jgi:hypothetical protein
MKIDRRDFMKIAVSGLAGLTGLGTNSCKKGGSNRVVVQEPPNDSPVAFLRRESPNNGKMKYIVSGLDSDGFLERIDTSFNGEEPLSFFEDRYEVAKPITERDNLFEATVYDDRGARGDATDSFRVASHEEARQHIESLLINARASYRAADSETDRLKFYLNDDPVFVDFIVESNPSNFSVIRYADITDPLEEVMNDERRLNSHSLDNRETVNNLFLYRLPLEEVTPLVKSFISRNYRRKL